MNAIATLPARLQIHRGRLALLLVLCAGIYFAVAFGEQAWRARELREDVAQHQVALAGLARENATLQQQVDLYSTDAYFDYVQGRARRDLSLANPGETLLLVHWDETAASQTGEQPPPIATPAAKPNWKRWIELFDRGQRPAGSE